MSNTKVSQRITGARKALIDYKNYLKSPLPGTKIFPIESDIRTYHVNTKVPEGIFKDLVIHWVLTIPEDYPFKAPFGQLPYGLLFPHHHIYSDGFCNNFLQNYEYMNQSSGSYDGWSPGCTFDSLMLAMKVFFNDHDLDKSRLAGARRAAENIFSNYKCRECGSVGEVFEEATEVAKVEIEKQLTCEISHMSFADDPQMILGYPCTVVSRRTNLGQFDILRLRLPDVQLFPEIISYESYMSAWALKLQDGARMRTPLGHEYTNWIPIYINDAHYKRSKNYLYTLLSSICYGDKGGYKYDYQPIMFIKVFPSILNGIVVQISNCQSYESDALISAFTNILKTFIHANRVERISQANTEVVSEFIKDKYKRSKKFTPNLGEWLFNLAISNYKLENSIPTVLQEMFPRLCFWIKKQPNNPFDLRLNPSTYEEAKRRFFDCAKVSLRLFLFNVICLKEHLDLSLEQGLLPQDKLNLMRERIKSIKEVNSMEEFFRLVGDEGDIIQRIKFAYWGARKLGYFY